AASRRHPWVAHAASRVVGVGGAAAVAAALLPAALVAGNAEIRIVVAVVVEARLAREVATAVGPIVVVVSPSPAAGHRFSVPFAVSHPVLQVTDAGAPVEGVGLA